MRRLPILLGLLVPALAAAPAQAATFYVDGSAASTTNPCTAPSTPCMTIVAAMTQARGAGFPGGDRIQVAHGSYSEQIGLLNLADGGDEFVGAGSGSNPATATIITGPAADQSSIVMGLGITVRGLRVRVASVKTNPAINVQSGGANVDDVVVEVTAAGHNQPGVAVNGALTASHLTVTSAGTGIGLTANGQLSIVDSDIEGGTAGIGRSALDVVSGQMHVQRSLLRSPATTTFGAAVVEGGAFVLDSSLVLGGVSGLYVRSSSVSNTASAVIRHTTIDAGARGPGGTDDSVRAIANLAPTHAQIADSIALEAPIVVAGGTVSCTTTDIPAPAVPTGIDCGASGANVSSTATTLFADLAGGDYRLKLGSPAVETGASAALAADESTSDLAGGSRVLDGNLDCVARSDKGAYELTGLAATCPVALPPAAVKDVTAPVISRLSMIRTKARVRVAAKKPAPKGTGFRYTLSEAASITITLERRTTGRRSGRSCVKATHANRRKRACTRYVAAGTLPSIAADDGANTTAFSGRIRGHKLAVGDYRATLQAIDAAGNRSKARTVSFSIVKR